MTNILTYGTFDLFHYGHERILNRAAALGERLHVGVSSDSFNAEKGKSSWRDEGQRKLDVKTFMPDAVVFHEYSFAQKTLDIKRFKIDIFVMGDDWAGKFDWLSDLCQVIYLPRTEGISTTMLKMRATQNVELAKTNII